MKIFVMSRGWNLYGEVKDQVQQGDEMFLELKRCGVIRRWGTTEGLGQLAKQGPLEETILDPEPDGTRIGVLEIHREIPCETNAWKSVKNMTVKE